MCYKDILKQAALICNPIFTERGDHKKLYTMVLTLPLLAIFATVATAGGPPKGGPPSFTTTATTTTTEATTTTTEATATEAKNAAMEAIVTALIDARTCDDVSANDNCGDDAESYYYTFEYGDSRIVVTSGYPNHK